MGTAAHSHRRQRFQRQFIVPAIAVPTALVPWPFHNTFTPERSSKLLQIIGNEIGADGTRIGAELGVCTSEQICVDASSSILFVGDA